MRLALSLFLIVAFAVPALAGPFEDAVAKFANDDFSDTDEAIGAIATSGNPLGFPIISALQDGRLVGRSRKQEGFHHAGRRQDHRCRDRRCASPSCPTALPPCASTTACAASVEAALGSLTLLSPDPAKRIAAAQSVFKIA